MQLRTDGVHCRESAGSGPENLKVVSSERVLPWQVTMDQLLYASLPTIVKTIQLDMRDTQICIGEIASCVNEFRKSKRSRDSADRRFVYEKRSLAKCSLAKYFGVT